MKNKPALVVSAVVVGLVVITAVATVTSTTPKEKSVASTEVAGEIDAGAGGIDSGGKSQDVPAKLQPNMPGKPPAAKTPKLTEIDWETSFEAALLKSKSTGKPLMVDFYADWCGACKHLDQNIYSASPVISESGNFINVKVDADKRTDLQSKFQVSGLPTIVWINPEGNEIKRLQGAPQEPDYMVQMMREALTAKAPDSVL